MKKIAFIVGFYPLVRGGSELQARYLCDELKSEFKIFYISVNGMHIKNEIIEIDGIRVYTFRTKNLLNRENYVLHKTDIVTILKIEKPDLIYVRQGNSSLGYAAQYCNNGNSCKLIFHVSSQNQVQKNKIQISKNILFDWIDMKYYYYGFKSADQIICQAKYQRDIIKTKYKKLKTEIIYNIHKPAKEKIIKEKPFKIVWIGNIKFIKRPYLFIKIAESLKDNSDVNLIMAGRNNSAEFSEKIEKISSQLHNFSFLGEIENREVNSILSSSHLLINTSLSEGFSNVFIQAWMHENVIVSLNVDPDDILKKENIGFHSKSFDRLLFDIEFLLNNENIITDMGKRARIFAEKVFDYKINTQKFRRLIQDTI